MLNLLALTGTGLLGTISPNGLNRTTFTNYAGEHRAFLLRVLARTRREMAALEDKKTMGESLEILLSGHTEGTAPSARC